MRKKIAEGARGRTARCAETTSSVEGGPPACRKGLPDAEGPVLGREVAGAVAHGDAERVLAAREDILAVVPDALPFAVDLHPAIGYVHVVGIGAELLLLFEAGNGFCTPGIDRASADKLLTTTRSVRKRLDLDRPVEPEVIAECIDIALQAPTGTNAQNWSFVVVTDAAKRKVAIALRNRWRRQQLPEHLRDEVAPKNIIMIGPTGVGKTEIARRLSKLVDAPFIKVEATKFTEVGYVGRDVEQIARDLMEVSLEMARERLRRDVKARAELAAEDRVIEEIGRAHV